MLGGTTANWNRSPKNRPNGLLVPTVCDGSIASRRQGLPLVHEVLVGPLRAKRFEAARRRRPVNIEVFPQGSQYSSRQIDLRFVDYPYYQTVNLAVPSGFGCVADQQGGTIDLFDSRGSGAQQPDEFAIALDGLSSRAHLPKESEWSTLWQ